MLQQYGTYSFWILASSNNWYVHMQSINTSEVSPDRSVLAFHIPAPSCSVSRRSVAYPFALLLIYHTLRTSSTIRTTRKRVPMKFRSEPADAPFQKRLGLL
jgi:hypothetical protein